jgi:hypothetical protein
MNFKLITLVSVMALAGCSSPNYQSQSNPSGQVNPGQQTAISEQSATEDFKRDGIKIIYGMFSGGIEAIEVTGYAPVWGNSASAIESSYKVAELDAKRKLNDFINKESITSSTSVEIISKNLEKATDNKSNNIANNTGAVSTSDTETTGQINQTVRQDALTISSRLQQNIRTSSRGILGGLRMIDNEVVGNGRNVKVVFRWDKKNEKGILDVRKSMMR